MAACIFCRAKPAKWSEEHVTPQWLLEHLGITRHSRMTQGYSGEEDRTREFSAYRFVEGRVCTSCNTGWMSRLETAAAPIVTSLVDGTANLAELSPAE